MLELPGVTLVCIDCVHHELALAAVEQSVLRCRFGDTLFVTDRPLAIPQLRVVEVPPVVSSAAYSRFVANDLVRHVATPHALLIRWDAFVVHPPAWNPAFLLCDYIAPRPEPGDEGTAGIALISRRLLEALADPRVAEVANVDYAIRSTYRQLLEREFGIAYPPPGLGDQFAFGDVPPVGQPFGFQGLFNMWMYFQPRDLDAFLAMASPDILASPDTLSLAINLRRLGRVDEARAVLRAILASAPGHAAAQIQLGQLDSMVRAVPSIPQSARIAGRNDPCPCGSGQKFKQCHGKLTGAPTPLPAASTVPVVEPPAGPVPDDFAARGSVAVSFHLASAAFERKEFDAAERLYRAILGRLPDDPVAIGFLGVIETGKRRYEDARRLLQRAIDIAPGAPEHHNNFGLLEHSSGAFAEAEAAYRRALELQPDYAAAHNNLGLALQEEGEVSAAIESFRAAIRSYPEFAEAHWNLALALLLDGQFVEGFAEQEWRVRVARHRDWWARRNQCAEWQGEPLAGKRFLLLAEQGMGDMIQFVRYASDLAARGAVLHVEAAPELHDLFRTTPGVSAIVGLDGPYPYPACDYQAPMLSLPHRCGTRVETIPAPANYVVADAQCRVRWRTLLGPRVGPRVGLAWAGNPDHVRDAFRSLPLAALSPLIALPGVEWISLQKGAAAAQIATLPPELVLRDLAAAAARDFADSAALIAELELVITVDTSIVHLAGALGAPSLLLLDSANDWRWLQRRVDSPWYPSVTLLRQARRGDWAGVVQAAINEVRLRLGV